MKPRNKMRTSIMIALLLILAASIMSVITFTVITANKVQNTSKIDINQIFPQNRRNLPIYAYDSVEDYACVPSRCQTMTSELVTMHNRYRSAMNLPTLTWNSDLAESARWRNNYIVENNHFSHCGISEPNGECRIWELAIDDTNYNFFEAGENLAHNFDNASNNFSAWLDSPSHLSLISDPVMRDIGIHCKEDFQDTEEIQAPLVTVHFGVTAN